MESEDGGTIWATAGGQGEGRGENRVGQGAERAERLSGLQLDVKLSGRQRMKVEHVNLGTRVSHRENEILSQ